MDFTPKIMVFTSKTMVFEAKTNRFFTQFSVEPKEQRN
jgi:hypothetical protein